MHHLETEYELFPTAFLGVERELINDRGYQAGIYESSRYLNEEHSFDFEAMAEIPAALNAFMESQRKSVL